MISHSDQKRTSDDSDLATRHGSNGRTGPGDAVTIDIRRAALSQSEFDQKHGLQDPEEPSYAELTRTLVAAKCSRRQLLKSFLGFFPFIGLLQTYKWKTFLIPDIIAGLCLGAVNVPQGLGFAMLASLPPVYGLYSSLVPAALYFFFGTSNHISLGTMVIPSMMTGAVVDREFPKLFTSTLNESIGNTTAQEADAATAAKVGIATSLCLLMGLIQCGMGLLKMGNLASYMSTTFVHAFLSGSAYHIVVSQLPLMLGLNLKSSSGIGKIPKNVVNICSHIKEVNPAAIVGSLISIASLFFLKEFINVKYEKKLKVPIPADLIVLVLGTLVSYLARLDDTFDVIIVRTVPAGFPAPEIPPMEGIGGYAVDAFIIGLVSFTLSISMAKLFAERYHYDIDTEQEMVAYGLCYGIGSFFHCYPGSQAPVRTLINESAGGKTQVSNLVSSAVLVLVCVVMGPLFESLPVCVLGSIISMAVLSLFKQVRDFPRFWKINKIDGIVWALTMVSVVFLDVIIGLAVGFAASLLLMVLQAQLQKTTLVSNVRGTEIYRQGALYLDTEDAPGVKIFQMNPSLFFANVHVFKERVFQSAMPSHAVIHAETGEESEKADKKGQALELIVLDCSALTYVDFMGVHGLKQLRDWCNHSGVKFALAVCNRKLINQLKNIGMLGDNDVKLLYPTVFDAVVSVIGWNKSTAIQNTRF